MCLHVSAREGCRCKWQEHTPSSVPSHMSRQKKNDEMENAKAADGQEGRDRKGAGCIKRHLCRNGNKRFLAHEILEAAAAVVHL